MGVEGTEIASVGGDGDRSNTLLPRGSMSLLISVRDLCILGLAVDRGGGEGDNPESDFSRFGDLIFPPTLSLTRIVISSTSSTVVDSASLDVFRFKRIGDNERGDDGESDKVDRVSSAMSIFVSTFLRGGREAGLGLANGESGSSGEIPSPCGRSGEPSCTEMATAFERLQIIIVPSNPVLTIVSCRLEPASPR